MKIPRMAWYSYYLLWELGVGRLESECWNHTNISSIQSFRETLSSIVRIQCSELYFKLVPLGCWFIRLSLSPLLLTNWIQNCTMSNGVDEIREKFGDLYLHSKFEEDLNDDSKTANSKRKCLYQAYSLANSL